MIIILVLLIFVLSWLLSGFLIALVFYISGSIYHKSLNFNYEVFILLFIFSPLLGYFNVIFGIKLFIKLIKKSRK